MPTRRPNTLKGRILFIHAGLLALVAILWAPKILNAEALFTISALSKQRNGVVHRLPERQELVAAKGMSANACNSEIAVLGPSQL